MSYDNQKQMFRFQQTQRDIAKVKNARKHRQRGGGRYRAPYSQKQQHGGHLEGDKVFAEFKDDGEWYVAKITDKDTTVKPPTYTVYFINYNNYQSKTMGNKIQSVKTQEELEKWNEWNKREQEQLEILPVSEIDVSEVESLPTPKGPDVKEESTLESDLRFLDDPLDSELFSPILKETAEQLEEQELVKFYIERIFGEENMKYMTSLIDKLQTEQGTNLTVKLRRLVDDFGTCQSTHRLDKSEMNEIFSKYVKGEKTFNEVCNDVHERAFLSTEVYDKVIETFDPKIKEKLVQRIQSNDVPGDSSKEKATNFIISLEKCEQQQMTISKIRDRVQLFINDEIKLKDMCLSDEQLGKETYINIRRGVYNYLNNVGIDTALYKDYIDSLDESDLFQFFAILKNTNNKQKLEIYLKCEPKGPELDSPTLLRECEAKTQSGDLIPQKFTSITKESYDKFAKQISDDSNIKLIYKDAFSTIDQDVPRTFPETNRNELFNKQLSDILKIYVLHSKKHSYTQGMSDVGYTVLRFFDDPLIALNKFIKIYDQPTFNICRQPPDENKLLKSLLKKVNIEVSDTVYDFLTNFKTATICLLYSRHADDETLRYLLQEVLKGNFKILYITYLKMIQDLSNLDGLEQIMKTFNKYKIDMNFVRQAENQFKDFITQKDIDDYQSQLLNRQYIGNYDLPENANITIDYLTDELIAKSFKLNKKIPEKENRQLFLDKIFEILKTNNGDAQDEKSLTKMEELLSKKGAELYKKAVEEEKKDINYIKKVFYNATYIPKNKNSKKFDKKTVLWVGGPSGSGKTTAAKRVITRLYKDLDDKYFIDSDDSDKYVFIDGGIEREVSQMRQLVIQAALSKGYIGISDLSSSKYWGHKIKSNMHEIVKNIKNVHVVIPSTFTEGEHPDIKYYSEQSYNHFFCELTTESAKYILEAKRVIKFMATRRAFKPKGEKVPIENRLKLEWNKKPEIESKKYNKTGFFLGYTNTKIGLQIYLKSMSKKKKEEIVYIKVANDLVKAILEEDSSLKECEPNTCPQGSKILISNRYLNEWNKLMASERNNILNTYTNKNKSVEEWGKSNGFLFFIKICEGLKEAKQCNIEKSVNELIPDYNTCKEILSKRPQFEKLDENSQKDVIVTLYTDLEDKHNLVKECEQLSEKLEESFKTRTNILKDDLQTPIPQRCLDKPNIFKNEKERKIWIKILSDLCGYKVIDMNNLCEDITDEDLVKQVNESLSTYDNSDLNIDYISVSAECVQYLSDGKNRDKCKLNDEVIRLIKSKMKEMSKTQDQDTKTVTDLATKSTEKMSKLSDKELPENKSNETLGLVRNNETLVNILFVRHGLSCSNLLKEIGTGSKLLRYHTLYRDPPLTEIGIKESKNAGYLTKKYLESKRYNINVVGSSGLIRAMQTGAHMFNDNVFVFPYISEISKLPTDIPMSIDKRSAFLSSNDEHTSTNVIDLNKGKYYEHYGESDYNKFLAWFGENLPNIVKNKDIIPDELTIAIVTHGGFIKKQIIEDIEHDVNNNDSFMASFKYNMKNKTLVPINNGVLYKVRETARKPRTQFCSESCTPIQTDTNPVVKKLLDKIMECPVYKGKKVKNFNYHPITGVITVIYTGGNSEQINLKRIKPSRLESTLSSLHPMLRGGRLENKLKGEWDKASPFRKRQLIKAAITSLDTGKNIEQIDQQEQAVVEELTKNVEQNTKLPFDTEDLESEYEDLESETTQLAQPMQSAQIDFTAKFCKQQLAEALANLESVKQGEWWKECKALALREFGREERLGEKVEALTGKMFNVMEKVAQDIHRLDSQIKKLEKEKRDMEEKGIKDKSILKGYTDRIIMLKKQEDELRQEILGKAKEILDVQVQMETDFDNKIKQIKTKLADCEGLKNKFMIDRSEFKERKDYLEARKESLEDQLKDKENELERTKRSKDRIVENIKKLDAKKKVILSMKLRLEDQVKILEQNIDNLDSEQQKQFEKHKVRVSELQNEINDLEAEISTFEETQDENEKKIKRLEREREQIEREHERDIEEQDTDYTRIIGTMKTNIEGLDDNISKLKTREQNLLKLQKVGVDLGELVNDVDSGIDEDVSKINNLDDLLGKISSLDEETLVAVEVLNELESELELLEMQKIDYESHIDDKRNELNEITTKIAANKKHLDQILEGIRENVDMVGIVEELQQENKKLQNKVDNYTELISEYQSEFEVMESKLDRLRQTVKQQTEQLKINEGLKADLEQAEGDLDATDKLMEDLKRSNKTLERHNKLLLDQVNTIKQYQKQLKLTQDKLSAIEKSHGEIQIVNEELDKKLQRLQEKRREDEREKDTLKEKLRKLEAELDTEASEVEKTLKVGEIYQKLRKDGREAELYDKIGKLEKTKEGLLNTLEGIRQELIKVKAERDKIKKLIPHSNEQAKQLREKEDKIKLLEAQLEGKEDELDNIQSQLEKMIELVKKQQLIPKAKEDITSLQQENASLKEQLYECQYTRDYTMVPLIALSKEELVNQFKRLFIIPNPESTFEKVNRDELIVAVTNIKKNIASGKFANIRRKIEAENSELIEKLRIARDTEDYANSHIEDIAPERKIEQLMGSKPYIAMEKQIIDEEKALFMDMLPENMHPLFAKNNKSITKMQKIASFAARSEAILTPVLLGGVTLFLGGLGIFSTVTAPGEISIGLGGAKRIPRQLGGESENDRYTDQIFQIMYNVLSSQKLPIELKPLIETAVEYAPTQSSKNILQPILEDEHWIQTDGNAFPNIIDVPVSPTPQRSPTLQKVEEAAKKSAEAVQQMTSQFGGEIDDEFSDEDI